MAEIVPGIVRGGKVELIDGPDLADGLQVQVVLGTTPAEPVAGPAAPGRRFTDFIGRGRGLYPDMEAADRAIREGRDAWG